MTVLRILTLASTWCVLTRELSPSNVALGLALSSLLVVSIGRSERQKRRKRARRSRGVLALGLRSLLRPLLALELTIFFLWELVVTNVRIAMLVLRPGLRLRPVIIAVSVQTESEEELAVVSDLVTLTPGTLSLDVADDGETLVVHVLSAEDAQVVRRQIEAGLVRRVRRLFA